MILGGCYGGDIGVREVQEGEDGGAAVSPLRARSVEGGGETNQGRPAYGHDAGPVDVPLGLAPHPSPLVAPTEVPDVSTTTDGLHYELGLQPSDDEDRVLAQVDVGGQVEQDEEQSLRTIICARSWPCSEALAIVYGPTATCPTGESNGDPSAISWDGSSFGLMQLHAETWAPVFPEFWERWMDAEWNVAAGWEIYKRAGSFSPWSCAW